MTTYKSSQELSTSHYKTEFRTFEKIFYLRESFKNYRDSRNNLVIIPLSDTAGKHITVYATRDQAKILYSQMMFQSIDRLQAVENAQLNNNKDTDLHDPFHVYYSFTLKIKETFRTDDNNEVLHKDEFTFELLEII